MQTKLTIEMIVDYRDKNKLPPIIKAGARAAAMLNAKVQLINDGQPPQVIYYSDDFFTGRTELEYLHEEMLQEQTTGNDRIRMPDGSLSASRHIAECDRNEQPSDEFLKALKGE